MDITTATPVEIDTALYALYVKVGEATAQRDRQIHAAEEMEEGARKAAEGNLRYSGWTQEQADAYWAKAAEYAKVIDALHAEAEPLNDEFDRRGGWTRAFLVTNVNGHVHSSMSCSTCFPTTRYQWMVEFSAKSETEIVEAAGERACTVCYPSAPVDVLKRPTQMFTEDEIAKQQAREEREAKRAKAEAEKITVEGFIDWGRTKTKEFKTERAAWMAAVSARKDILWYGGSHPTTPEWVNNAERVEAALAARTGRTLEDVKADVAKRAQSAYKREMRG